MTQLRKIIPGSFPVGSPDDTPGVGGEGAKRKDKEKEERKATR